MTGEWRTPEQLVAIGYSRSRVVMMNEAHSGMLRCIRTREIGRRMLPIAHACGVRHIAMEALGGPYVEQPDLAALIEDARSLGWELIPYEDHDSKSPYLADGSIEWSSVNAREFGQARNLASALPETPALVWCGGSHLCKRTSGEFRPMGSVFWELTGIEPFSLDQTPTAFGDGRLAADLRADLEPLGGTAGMLAPELPEPFCRGDADAFLFSVDNDLT